MKPKLFLHLVLFALLSVPVEAQLSGPVGTTNSPVPKNSETICNLPNYGANADNRTDVEDTVTSAFAACKAWGIVTDAVYFLEL
ncbi:hypothetical protein IFR04_012282 [Cadophora malorum]|uniref:Pectate lyase superfamily protein domain-containing protein n=1 Tax=Cadophora malorum TaxID=108018 RepID=A0A8H7W8B1_9HELO|nr:hypothetical protein IFR04_012282 [Cadophora malorum]|tara:strand:- start:220 stop:471 length:252 start_codon:yes stop_codon:yes gene_type:complete